jgi:hypothetical protein
VGIGTASPAGRLDCSSSANAGVNYYFRNRDIGSGSKPVTINWAAADTIGSDKTVGSISVQGYTGNYVDANMIFSTQRAGTLTQAMTLDASGNLGLGVTPSAWGLMKALQVTGGPALAGLDNNTYLGANWYFDGANSKYIATDFATLYTQSDGAHKWERAASGTAGNTISFTTAMTLDASSNLTVGTASAGSIYMMNYTASTIGTRLGANPSDQTFTLNTRNGVAGSTSGTEIARLCWGYGGTDSAYISAERNGGTGANRINVVCNMSAGVFLAAGGTSWGSLSDERQKTNLEPIVDASNKLNTLRTVTGRYITDEETVSRAFLIAQDVQKVLPEAVDAQEDEEGTLGLRYTDLIPLLIAGFKEQQAMIDELKAKVAALEAA